MLMQRDFLLTTERMAVSIAMVIFCALFSASMASSPISEVSPSKFNLSNPQQRKAFVDTLRERRQPGIERAKEYLRRTGKPKKWTDGVNVFELMAIENGQFIVYSTANANSAISIAADVVRDEPYYWMSGEGITVGVWDEGLALQSHQELIGRVHPKDAANNSSHSTHVTGTIAAAGIDPEAIGMAPLSEVDNYDWDDDIAEMALVAMSEPGEQSTIQTSNHSYVNLCGWFKDTRPEPDKWYWYGNPDDQESDLFGQYNSLAYDFDNVCYNAPYFLPFRGAGNDRGDSTRPNEGESYDYVYLIGKIWYGGTSVFYESTGPYADNWDNGGFDTMTPGACAKNVMTVGAVNDAITDGSRDISKATMYYKSAWGPTDDGRVKPDLVTNGVGVKSCYASSDTAYATLSGTSMSSPAAAGAAVQLIDLYGRLFPGQYMRSSTLKALMIHTADDLGNPGPDYKFGWGLVNNEQSAETILLHKRNPTSLNITEDSLKSSNPNMDSYDDFIFVWEGTSPIKATLCWTDPPGTTTNELDSRTSRLVHDLDITITAPDGTTKYYEYVLDWLNPDDPATTGDNNRDNVKQIFIDSPVQQGAYTIRVDYDQLNGTQYYSLIISGQAQPAIQDLDGNGNIGFEDLLYLSGNWLTNDTISDIYPAVGDDLVDLLDFSSLAKQWLNP
jgi:hypothetical protein